MTTAEQISRCQYRRDKLAAVQATIDMDDLIGMSYLQGQIDLLSEQIAELRRREDKRGK